MYSLFLQCLAEEVQQGNRVAIWGFVLDCVHCFKYLWYGLFALFVVMLFTVSLCLCLLSLCFFFVTGFIVTVGLLSMCL